jgi:hypothetical protein
MNVAAAPPVLAPLQSYVVEVVEGDPILPLRKCDSAVGKAELRS